MRFNANTNKAPPSFHPSTISSYTRPGGRFSNTRFTLSLLIRFQNGGKQMMFNFYKFTFKQLTFEGFFISICRFPAWFTFFSYANDLYAPWLFLKAVLKPHLRLLLISNISTITFIPWTSKNFVKSQLINHPYLEGNLNLLKPAGEVFPPRRSGILRASLCQHQQNSYQNICRPRIPHALCLCGFSHRLLQYDERGANSLVCCHFHTS